MLTNYRNTLSICLICGKNHASPGSFSIKLDANQVLQAKKNMVCEKNHALSAKHCSNDLSMQPHPGYGEVFFPHHRSLKSKEPEALLQAPSIRKEKRVLSLANPGAELWGMRCSGFNIDASSLR